MNKAIAAGVVLLAAGVLAHAQENLVGDWSGTFRYRGVTARDFDVGVQLKIVGVKDNIVTGSATTTGGSCAGEYQMRGKLDGNKLGMISTNTAGAAGDCKFGFRAAIDGNTMKGTVGSNDMTLTRK